MTRWHSRWSRVRDILRGSRLDRDIDDELRFHLDEEIEAAVNRGLTPEQAREAAHRSLGGTPWRVREAIRDVRRVSLADDFRCDTRHALRLLRQNPTFALIVICTLGVAIGAVGTAFSITDAWLFRPLRFPEADRLVVAFAATPAQPGEPAVWMPYRAYLAFKASAHTFSSVAAASFQNATWRTRADARSVVGMRVTPEFFATFGVQPLRGHVLGASDVSGPPAVVLSHGFWQRELGGNDGVLGTRLTLSDASYTVVGVMPRDFDVRLLDQREGAAFWTLLPAGERGYEPDGIGPVAVVGRLRPGTTIEMAQTEVVDIMRRTESAYRLNFNDQFVATLTSLQADNTRTIRSTLLTVLTAALSLLLIASTNVGVLLLGRGLGRRGEVAVRHALGAARTRMVRQFLAESLVLSVAGATLGIALAAVGIRLFLGWNPLGTLPANAVALDLRVLGAVLLLMAITTIVAGLVPAIRISAAGPAAAMGASERWNVSAPAHRAQRGMLAMQMAVSTVLLLCAALLARTFIQLRTEPLGFASDDVTVATVILPKTAFDSGSARNAFYDRFEERLLARPGVRAAAAGTSLPLDAGPPTTVNVTSADDVSAPRISTQDVTASFFETLGIPLVAGRAFDRRDGAPGAPVVMVNARAATALFGSAHSAVGKRVRLDKEPWREVIGVAGNVHTTFFNTLEWRTDPIVYRPAAQAFSDLAPMATSFTMWVHLRADRLVTATDVRNAARAADPGAAVIEVQRVGDLVAAATKQPTFRMTLLLWFCAASLLLAAIGVYGMVAQAVTERLREVAIRVALGAHPRLVIAAFMRRALAAAGFGVVIGVVIALILAGPLESLLYGVRPRDAASLALAAVLLLTVTGVAAWVPALRARRPDTLRLLGR